MDTVNRMVKAWGRGREGLEGVIGWEEGETDVILPTIKILKNQGTL